MKPTPGMEAGMGMARLVADGLGWQVRMPGEPTRKAEFIDLPGDAPHGEIAQEGGLDLCPAHAEQVQQ